MLTSSFCYFTIRQTEDNWNKLRCLLARSVHQHKHHVWHKQHVCLTCINTSSIQSNTCLLSFLYHTSSCFFYNALHYLPSRGCCWTCSCQVAQWSGGNVCVCVHMTKEIRCVYVTLQSCIKKKKGSTLFPLSFINQDTKYCFRLYSVSVQSHECLCERVRLCQQFVHFINSWLEYV